MHHVTSVRWPVSTTCLVDEHSVPRMPNRLVVPPPKLSTVGSRAFAVAASHIWNTLSTDVVAASSLSTFRRLVNLSYSSCHILTSSTDIIQLVVLAVVAPLRSLIDWLIDWLTGLTAAKQGRLVLGWCSNAVRLFANGSSPEVHVLWTSSAGPFVISLFLFVKIDLATDSGSEYDRDQKKNRVPFFLTCVTVVFWRNPRWPP